MQIRIQQSRRRPFKRHLGNFHACSGPSAVESTRLLRRGLAENKEGKSRPRPESAVLDMLPVKLSDALRRMGHFMYAQGTAIFIHRFFLFYPDVFLLGINTIPARFSSRWRRAPIWGRAWGRHSKSIGWEWHEIRRRRCRCRWCFAFYASSKLTGHLWFVKMQNQGSVRKECEWGNH